MFLLWYRLWFLTILDKQLAILPLLSINFLVQQTLHKDLFCQQCKVVAILSGVVEMSFQTLTQSDWDQETAFAWRLGLRVVEGVPSKNHKQQVPLLHSTISMQSNMKVMASLPRMITMIILTTSKMLF